MEEEKAAAYYDELVQKGSGAAKFKRGLGFGTNGGGEKSGEFLGFKSAEGIVDVEETEARKVLAADNVRSKLSRGREESKRYSENRSWKGNESRKPDAPNRELKVEQKTQRKHGTSNDSRRSGSRERYKARRRGRESESPRKVVKRSKKGGGGGGDGKESESGSELKSDEDGRRGKKGDRGKERRRESKSPGKDVKRSKGGGGKGKGSESESGSGSELKSDEDGRRGKKGDRGKEREAKRGERRRWRSASTDTSGSSREDRKGKEGIRRHEQEVGGNDRWRPSRSLSRERSYERKEDLGKRRDSQTRGGKREVDSNRIQRQNRSRSRSPDRDSNRRRRRQYSSSPDRQISRRREREKIDGNRSRKRDISRGRSRSRSRKRSRSPVQNRRSRSRSPRYRKREERIGSRRRSRSRSRSRSRGRIRRRSHSRSRERERERGSRKVYRSSIPGRRRQSLERERRESSERGRRRRRSPSDDKFTSVFSKAPEKDYSKLIPGFDDMNAVEKIKAKTKLQLSEAVVRDSQKGMSTEWERFEFDKDAPLDDDAKQDYFGDGTGAKEDTDFLQNRGTTFVSSRGQVAREARTTSLHDFAIFGSELKDKKNLKTKNPKNLKNLKNFENFDTHRTRKLGEENKKSEDSGRIFLGTNGTSEKVLEGKGMEGEEGEEEDEEDKPVVVVTENGNTENGITEGHKEEAVSSVIVSEKVVEMQKNMTWQERARKMKESRKIAPL